MFKIKTTLKTQVFNEWFLEAEVGIEPTSTDLQSAA